MRLHEELKQNKSALIDDAMKAPCCKEAKRKELEADMKEFLRRKGKVVELAPSTERAETFRF